MTKQGTTYPGVFITFEGGEGVGKSTQIRFLAQHLEDAGYTVDVLREPGGTQISEAIRSLLLNPENTEINYTAELLLYEASRAQLVAERIRPALEAGHVVLCDRFFDSTTVYQGIARDLGIELVEQLNLIACGGIVPQRTIVLRLDASTGLKRATSKGADRMELAGADFHEQVYQGFEVLQQRDPQRIRFVSTCPEKEETQRLIFEEVRDLFPEMND